MNFLNISRTALEAEWLFLKYLMMRADVRYTEIVQMEFAWSIPAGISTAWGNSLCNITGQSEDIVKEYKGSEPHFDLNYRKRKENSS